MRVRVSVYHKNGFPDNYVDMEVPEFIVKEFKSVDFVSDLTLVHGNSIPNFLAESVYKIRKDSVKELSTYIAELLVKEMSKNDTIDGYES